MAINNKILLAVAVAATGVVVWAYIGATTGPDVIKGADTTNPVLVARGEKIYADNCASCHGDNRQGQPNWRKRNEDGTLPAPPHDESGHTWHHTDQQNFDYVKFGGSSNNSASFKSAMPAFSKTLSDDEIWAVIAFIKSKWPEKIQKRRNKMMQR